jgi:hypothetical protein
VELVSATATEAETVVVTLADGCGLTRLEATRDEVASLCDAMEEAALLARASCRAAWLAAVPAGADVVRIGVAAGRVRVIVAAA